MCPTIQARLNLYFPVRSAYLHLLLPLSNSAMSYLMDYSDIFIKQPYFLFYPKEVGQEIDATLIAMG